MSENLSQVMVRNGLQTTFHKVFFAVSLFLILPESNCKAERTVLQIKNLSEEAFGTVRDGHQV